MNNLKRAEAAALLYMTTTEIKLLPQALKMQAATDFEAGYSSALETVNTERAFAFRSIVQAFNYIQDKDPTAFGKEKALEILRYAIKRLK